jgi:hypothetical protein
VFKKMAVYLETGRQQASMDSFGRPNFEIIS